MVGNGNDMKKNKPVGGSETADGVDPQRQFRSALERVAWLPVPLLLAAILATRAAGLSESYENDSLRLVLSFTFYTLVSLGTLFLIGRSFLTSGSPGLLLLECGVVLWSLAGTVGDLVDHGDANINVTIFNTSILLAGLCHLAGAILSLRPQRSLRAKPLWLGAGCAFALAALGLITWAALAHWLPVFFIPGQGGTTVRYCVLISATAMFVLSAVLLHAGQRAASHPFTSWYSLALLLLAVGLFGIMIQLSLWTVVNWLGRTAQWLGGFYLLLAAIAALSESNLPLLPLEDKSRPALFRNAMAVAMVLAAAAVRLVFLSALGTHAPFVVFYPAVIFAALYGGRRAGLLATALSAILADYFWIEPVGQLAIATPADWLGLVIFLLSGTMIAWVAEALLRARARASEAEALKTSEERHRVLAETMLQGVVHQDAQGKIIAMNRAAERILGKTPEQFLGSNSVDEEHHTIREDGSPFPGLEHPAMVALQTGQPLSGVVMGVFNPKVNAYRWISIDAVPVFRPGENRPSEVYAVFEDITDRKRAEETLRRSEQEFRTLAGAVPQIVWATRPDGWNIYFNQQWMDYTGLTLDESYGHGWNTPFHPDDKQRAWDAWQRATQHDETYLLECRLRRADGVYRWWLIHGTPIRDANGKIQKWLGTCTDIEDLKQAEEALRESEQQFRALADSIPNLAWWANGDGYITWYNQRWYEYTGTTPEQIEGWGWQSVHDPHELPLVLER
jgi:PAS domain S-box-containing protein